ncbi:response regulator [Rhizobium leguminosarum]|uniref:response regulator n=1 Tax=Rhizobium leguminosarum TaxID=384 RepID=UPI001AEC4E5C|nr:response regulator transcription factor [Rhizobium leguminosarum]
MAGLLAGNDDIQIVGEAADGREAVELFDALRPDILLLDLQMPGMTGIEAMVEIRSRHPMARMVVLTTYDTEELAAQAMAAGAKGYLLKSSVRRELINTIRSVHAGRHHVNADVAESLAGRANGEALTKREITVLALIAEGLSNRLIGERLSISEEPVKTYVKSLLLKLGASGRAHAVAVGVKRGIISL